MREVSDRLCFEYGLSVVKEHSPDYPKYFTEWKAKNEGSPTWRAAIREDVDKAVKNSISFSAFIRNMRDAGYEVKTGVKHIAVRPLGKERYVRLKSLGEDYTEEKIRDRILSQPLKARKVIKPKFVKAKYIGSFHLSKRITWDSIRGLYYYFLNLLKKSKENDDGLYLIRDELRHMDKLSEQAKFLNANNIDTLDELEAYKRSSLNKIAELENQRKSLRNNIRKVNTTDNEKLKCSSEIKEISRKLKELRKVVHLCEDIGERSKDLKIKKEILREEKIKSIQPENNLDKQIKNRKR